MSKSHKERYDNWYNTPLTHERLLSLVSYNKETGYFSRLKGGKGIVRLENIGRIRKDGYVEITLDYKPFLAHRLAVFFINGEWPEETVDHKNHIRHDNRWVNLRIATYTENNQNSKLPSNNSTGFKGVSKRNGYFRATIRNKGKQEHIGVYKTPELAYIEYCKRAKEIFGEFYYED